MDADKKTIASAGAVLVCVMLLLNCLNLGCVDLSEKYTKILHMPPTALVPGSTFETVTHNGSIDVFGANVSDCNVVATIVGHARTVEAAEEVVEKTELAFEQSDGKLVLSITRPKNLISRSVSVSLNVVLPENVNLDVQSHNGHIGIRNITGTTKALSHNGAVEMENITGPVQATSHNGRILIRNASGTMKLESHNGAIEGENIAGDIDFLSHNGRVKAVFSESAPPDSDITMVTHNGSIDLTAPPDYSARIDISTHNGSIHTDLPVTVSGNVSKGTLAGTIRDGKGNMKLETHNGSIDIR